MHGTNSLSLWGASARSSDLMAACGMDGRGANRAVSRHMDSKKLAQLCRALAENRKAEDVVVLDVHALSSVTDYFVIATGTSEPHLRAIASEITTRLEEDEKLRPSTVDGSAQSNWLVIDYFDVIVHVMRKEFREKYDLEGLWGDAVRVRATRSRKVSAEAAAGLAKDAPDANP